MIYLFLKNNFAGTKLLKNVFSQKNKPLYFLITFKINLFNISIASLRSILTNFAEIYAQSMKGVTKICKGSRSLLLSSFF